MGMLQISNMAVKETSDTRKHALGTPAMTPDGRTFRFARANSSTDLVAANLQVAPDPVSNHQNQTVAVDASVGDKQVELGIGATAITADQYQDGYLVTQDGAGEGYQYRIEGHIAYDASASDVVVDLKDAIEVALTTSSEVSLEYSPYDNTVLSATDQGDMPTGVAHTAVDVSEARYYWLQTGGPAVVWGDEAFAQGAALTIGTGVAGQVEALDAAGEPQVGIAMRLGVVGEHTLAYLQLA